jgi:hypothetical protein
VLGRVDLAGTVKLFFWDGNMLITRNSVYTRDTNLNNSDKYNPSQVRVFNGQGPYGSGYLRIWVHPIGWPSKDIEG